jgi:hypothetical protein
MTTIVPPTDDGAVVPSAAMAAGIPARSRQAIMMVMVQEFLHGYRFMK